MLEESGACSYDWVIIPDRVVDCEIFDGGERSVSFHMELFSGFFGVT